MAALPEIWVGCVARVSLIIILQILINRQPDLPQVACALSLPCLLAGRCKNREENGGKNGYDCNHDEQFDQSKRALHTRLSLRIRFSHGWVTSRMISNRYPVPGKTASSASFSVRRTMESSCTGSSSATRRSEGRAGKMGRRCTPVGTVTLMTSRSESCCQLAMISPAGMGTMPLAHFKPQGLGANLTQEKPGSSGVTPRICAIRSIVGPML